MKLPFIVLSFSCSILVHTSVHPQTRDASFGTNGALVNNNGWSALSPSITRTLVRTSPEGSTYVSDLQVITAEGVSPRLVLYMSKFTAAGIHDESFGQNGSTYIHIPLDENTTGFRVPSNTNLFLESMTGVDLLFQPNGKVIAVFNVGVTTTPSGYEVMRTLVVRIDGTGDVDNGFGTNGYVYLSYDGTDVNAEYYEQRGFYARSAYLNSQGNIYIVGQGSPGNHLTLSRRLNNNGTIDITWGYASGGYTLALPVPGMYGGAQKLTKLIEYQGMAVVGTAIINNTYLEDDTNKQVIAATTTSNGLSLVTTFGMNGLYTPPIFTSGPADIAQLSAVDFQEYGGQLYVVFDAARKQGSGNWLQLGGERFLNRSSQRYWIARFNAIGQVDPGYGANGFAPLILDTDLPVYPTDNYFAQSLVKVVFDPSGNAYAYINESSRGNNEPITGFEVRRRSRIVSLNDSGAPNTAFSGTGELVLSNHLRCQEILDLAWNDGLQVCYRSLTKGADGATDISYQNSSTTGVSFAKYGANGVLDPDFGEQGLMHQYNVHRVQGQASLAFGTFMHNGTEQLLQVFRNEKGRVVATRYGTNGNVLNKRSIDSLMYSSLGGAYADLATSNMRWDNAFSITNGHIFCRLPTLMETNVSPYVSLLGRTVVLNADLELVSTFSDDLMTQAIWPSGIPGPSITNFDVIAYADKYYVFSARTGVNSKLFVFRLNNDFSFDMSFGNEGVSATDIPGNDLQNFDSYVVNAQGIFAFGRRVTQSSSDPNKVIMTKVGLDGMVDQTFGDYGSAILYTTNQEQSFWITGVDVTWMDQWFYTYVVEDTGAGRLFRVDGTGTRDLDWGGANGVKTFEDHRKFTSPMVMNDWIYYLDVDQQVAPGSSMPCTECSVSLMRMDTSATIDMQFGLAEPTQSSSDNINTFVPTEQNRAGEGWLHNPAVSRIVAGASGEKIYAFGTHERFRRGWIMNDVWSSSGLGWGGWNATIHRYCIDGTACSVSVPEQSVAQALVLRLFPNPASASLRVETDLQRPTLVMLTVLDAVGRKVMEQRSLAPVAELDVSKSAQGIYTLVCTAGDTRTTASFLVIP